MKKEFILPIALVVLGWALLFYAKKLISSNNGIKDNKISAIAIVGSFAITIGLGLALYRWK